MAPSKFAACLAFAVAAVLTSSAQAHVTVRPAEAAPAATMTYAVRVPSEGEVTTTSVELEIPVGVMVKSVEGPLESYELKKTGDLITAIVWKTAIPAGERAELKFSAQNPAQGTELVWKAHQRFKDGTSADWIEAKGGKRPASVTVLKAP
ncbi:MAG: DUF1775 domain-containing protein [Rhodospirillaceae bacterium]